MAEPRQGFARRAVAQFGLVAEGEQRLLAAGPGARLRDRQHLVAAEIGRLAAAQRVREGAVMADVAAQLRQRDEHLLRIGDEIAVPCVAQRRRDRHQRGEVVELGECQRVVGGEPGAGFGAGEKGRCCHKTIPPSPPLSDHWGGFSADGTGPASGGITTRRCCCRLSSLPPDIGGGEGRHVIREP